MNAKHCRASLRKRHAVTVSVMHALNSKQNNPFLFLCCLFCALLLLLTGSAWRPSSVACFCSLLCSAALVHYISLRAGQGEILPTSVLWAVHLALSRSLRTRYRSFLCSGVSEARRAHSLSLSSCAGGPICRWASLTVYGP